MVEGFWLGIWLILSECATCQYYRFEGQVGFINFGKPWSLAGGLLLPGWWSLMFRSLSFGPMEFLDLKVV